MYCILFIVCQKQQICLHNQNCVAEAYGSKDTQKIHIHKTPTANDTHTEQLFGSWHLRRR